MGRKTLTQQRYAMNARRMHCVPDAERWMVWMCTVHQQCTESLVFSHSKYTPGLQPLAMQLHAQRILMRTVTSPVSTSQRHPSNISPPCRARRCITAAATGNTPAAGDSKSPTSSPTMQPPIPTNEMAPAPKGVLGRIKRFFVGEKMDRERLKALGLGAVASYGMLSNLVYCTGTPLHLDILQDWPDTLVVGAIPPCHARHAQAWR